MIETFRAAARSTVRLHCVTAEAVPFTELGCAFFYVTLPSPQGTVRDFLSMLMFKKNIKDIYYDYIDDVPLSMENK